MELSILVETVRLMRAAQKEYFKTRSTEVLIRSKQLEKTVDTLCAQFNEDKTTEDPYAGENKTTPA